MFIIKWKKGLGSLNINENSVVQDEDAETKSEIPKVVVTRALKK
jgi:hypothetical protein